MKNDSLLFTTEIIDFLSANANGVSNRELCKMANRRFNKAYTVKQIKHAIFYYRIRANAQKLFTPEVIKYLSDNAPGQSYKALTMAVSNFFNTAYTTKQIKNACIRNKILTGTQRKLIPENIKKHIAENYKAVKSWVLLTENINKKYGTSYTAKNIKNYALRTLKVKIDLDNGKGKNLELYSEITREGYIYIKIGNEHKARNKNWVLKHRYLWEQEHGKLSEGKNIIFLDNNPLNCTLENLAMVNDMELSTMNGAKLKHADPAMTITGIAIARLGITIKRRLKGEAKQ